MDTLTDIARFFQEGGSFMYPILVTFIIGVAIALERFIYLSLVSKNNQRSWVKLYSAIASGKVDEAYSHASQAKDHLSQIVAGPVKTIIDKGNVALADKQLNEGFIDVMPRIEKRTAYLATFANIATLLGLLGTILGLIAAFSAVANADPAEKANMLSSSISVAMNTTAFGLIAAIPLLLCHSFLSSKTRTIADSLDSAVLKISNLFQSDEFNSNN